jgi:agmatine/peptidylarginine deiminase
MHTDPLHGTWAAFVFAAGLAGCSADDPDDENCHGPNCPGNDHAGDTGEPAEDTGDCCDSGGASSGLRVPAEWEPQDAVWMQWPQTWESTYEPAFSRIVAAILNHEDVHVLVNDARTREAAEATLQHDGGLSAGVVGGAASSAGFRITWHQIANDNAWMRDNGPRYVVQDGELRIQDWGFDGWGGAFGNIPYRADDAVPQAVADYLGLPVDTVEIVH